MPIHFAVLGDGAWGTAIALLLAQNAEHRVVLWSAREENGRILQERRENMRLLPGVPIPPAVELTTDITQTVAGADLWIAAIPTVYLRETLQRIAPALREDRPVLSLTKGMENGTFLRPTEILRQVLGTRPVAVLSGPSHAEEVSRGLPTTVVAASSDLELARWIQQRFGTDRFRVYTNLDVVGVELAGALKNVIGIAAGISDGLGFGDNAKAALLTRGLVEMARFGVALGAEQQTFFGLAGLGDLITTCISRHGRNRRVGERLGRGEKLADILASTPMVAEGVYTTRSVYDQAAQMGIAMPITTEVYRVLYENKEPLAAVNDLMLREPTSEKPLLPAEEKRVLPEDKGPSAAVNDLMPRDPTGEQPLPLAGDKAVAEWYEVEPALDPAKSTAHPHWQVPMGPTGEKPVEHRLMSQKVLRAVIFVEIIFLCGSWCGCCFGLDPDAAARLTGLTPEIACLIFFGSPGIFIALLSALGLFLAEWIEYRRWFIGSGIVGLGWTALVVFSVVVRFL